MKDKGTAAVLAFFLGALGVHRFYLGQAGLGIVYLLLCWTPVIWLVCLIDFIVFLTMSTRSFDQKYNPSRVQQAMAQPIMQNQVHVYHQSPVLNQNLPQDGNPARNTERAALADPARDGIEQLERLHSLKERGILSEEEFAIEKAKILGNSNYQGNAATAQDDSYRDPFLG